MKRSTLLIILAFALLAIGNTAAAVCHTVPDVLDVLDVLEDSKIPILPGRDTASKEFEDSRALIYHYMGGPVPESMSKRVKELLEGIERLKYAGPVPAGPKRRE